MTSPVVYEGFYGRILVYADWLEVVQTDVMSHSDLPAIRVPFEAVAAVRVHLPTGSKLGQLRLFVGALPEETGRLGRVAASADPLTVLFGKKGVFAFTALAEWLNQRLAHNQALGVDPTSLRVDVPSPEDLDRYRHEKDVASTTQAVKEILGPAVRPDILTACIHTGSLFGWKRSLQAFANALTPDETLQIWLPGTFAGGAAILGLTSSRVLVVRSDIDRTKIDGVLRTPQLRAEWIERWSTGLIKIADPTREFKVSGLDKAGGRLFASHVIAAQPPAPHPETDPSEDQGTDPYAALARLGELHKAGVLTAAEFEDAKSVLLRRL